MSNGCNSFSANLGQASVLSCADYNTWAGQGQSGKGQCLLRKESVGPEAEVEDLDGEVSGCVLKGQGPQHTQLKE